MAQQTQLLTKSYKNDANVRILKYTALVVGPTNGAGYAAPPTGANVGNIVGVALEDIFEPGVNPWTNGQPQIQSGQAPSAGAPSLQARNIQVAKSGIVRVIAAGAIAVGAPVNINDNQGRVKAVNEAGGTLVHVLGYAETAAANAGDIIHVFLAPHDRHQ